MHSQPKHDRLFLTIRNPGTPSTKRSRKNGRMRNSARVLVLLLVAALATAPDFTTPGDAASAAARWSWPTSSRTIMAPYRAPEDAYSAGHRGIDLEAAVGDAITAPADGVISFAGTVVDRGVLVVDHGGGIRSTFEPVSTGLVVGTSVFRGQAIGLVTADAGHCASTCLHFGVRIGDNYASPMLYLSTGRSVLLPL